MAHRAWEARARRNGEAAMTYRAQLLAPERDSAAQQAGSPTDTEAGFPRCSPLPRQLRDLPRAVESPRPYNEAKRRAFRDQAGKRPRDRLRRACVRMDLSGSLGSGCVAILIPAEQFLCSRQPPGPARSQTFSAVLLAAPTRRKFSCRSCAPICRRSAPIQRSMLAPPRPAPSHAAAGRSS